jgi:hypothetical protein
LKNFINNLDKTTFFIKNDNVEINGILSQIDAIDKISKLDNRLQEIAFKYIQENRTPPVTPLFALEQALAMEKLDKTDDFSFECREFISNKLSG